MNNYLNNSNYLGNYPYNYANQYVPQPQTRTIYIDSTLNGKFLKKVLCHELTHAAMFSYGIELSIEQEELLADLIATYGEEIILITNKIFKKLKEK